MLQPDPIPEDFGITPRDVERFERVTRIIGEPFEWMIRIAIVLVLIGMLMVLVGLSTEFDLRELGTLLMIRGGAAGAVAYLVWKVVWRVVARPLLRINRRFRAAQDYQADVSKTTTR